MEYKIVHVNGFDELYEVDTLGRVFSLNYKNFGYRKELKQTKDNNGYVMFTLTKEGISHKIRGHRVVGLSLIDNPSNYPFINHKNGIKHDNRLENLEWCTCKMNNDHAKAMGLTNILGSNHGFSKLNEEKVIEIRKIKKELNYSNAKIGRMFGVNTTTIWHVVNRTTWLHI